ncbi:unnamed protein product [Tilletia caries]|nr:unnamed protein product [Tilletia caries]
MHVPTQQCSFLHTHHTLSLGFASCRDGEQGASGVPGLLAIPCPVDDRNTVPTPCLQASACTAWRDGDTSYRLGTVGGRGSSSRSIRGEDEHKLRTSVAHSGSGLKFDYSTEQPADSEPRASLLSAIGSRQTWRTCKADVELHTASSQERRHDVVWVIKVRHRRASGARRLPSHERVMSTDDSSSRCLSTIGDPGMRSDHTHGVRRAPPTSGDRSFRRRLTDYKWSTATEKLRNLRVESSASSWRIDQPVWHGCGEWKALGRCMG